MYLLGIDLGTSGVKTALFDFCGNLAASDTVSYPLYQPQNGWAEQNPEDWWTATVQSIRHTIAKSGIKPIDIRSVGLSGQMHGLVMLDKNGQVLRKAILWCDGRTARECEELTLRVGAQKLIDITANPALTGFTASKILWVRNHEPDIYQACAHILLPKDFIRYRLTGEFATDVSDASGMQLLDIANRCWSQELLDILEIDRTLLADVYESCEQTGTITPQASAETGLNAGTVVAAGASDNGSAAVGNGCVRDGRAFLTIGTSGVVYAHTSQMLQDQKGRIHTFCAPVPGQWHVMGVTQAAGLSLKWLRDTICSEETAVAKHLHTDPYRLMDQEAALAPIGANRLLFLPYLMGERTPHLDPDIRGAFIGLSAIHTKADLIRAVLEGVSYSLCDCMEIIQACGVPIVRITACGGGSSSPLWREILADVLGRSIDLLNSKEGAALGAAILGGVSAKIYKSVEEACDNILQVVKTTETDHQNHQSYRKYYQIYDSLYDGIRQACKDLAGC